MTSERILIIDDEPNVLSLCELVLKAAGYTVELAADGQSGLKLVESQPFDLVLTDLNLPDTEGLDVLRQIKAAIPEMIVIIITGYGTVENATQAMRSGAQGLLLKPFSSRELRQVVSDALERQRLIRENMRLRAHLPLMEISRALMSEVDLSRLVDLALEVAQKETAADQGSLMLVDEERRELYIAAAIGLPPEVVGSTRLPMGQGIIERVIREKQPVLLDDSADVSSLFSSPAAPAQPMTTAVCLPLISKARVIGTLNLCRNASKSPFRQDDLELLSILAGQVAVAVDNARLVCRLQQQLDRWGVLNELSNAVLGAKTLEHVFRIIVHGIAQGLKFDRVALALVDKTGQELCVQMTTGFNESVTHFCLPLKEEAGVFAHCILNRRPLLIREAAADERLSSEERAMIGHGDFIVAPLLTWNPSDMDSTCWQYFHCSFTDCPAHGLAEVICWMLNGTCCRHDLPSTFTAKMEHCQQCDFYHLKRHSQPVGLIEADNALSQRPITTDDVAALRAFAATAAAAIENMQLYTELRQAMKEREQTQAQLIQAEKLAATGKLTASIAHEINNPLQAIQGCLVLAMESTSREDEIWQYLSVANEEIERVAAIIQRMRDFHRPAEKRMELTNVNALWDSVLALTRKQLEHSKVVVHRQFSSDLPPVMAVANALKQVFLNLVLNAVEAMPTGGELWLRTASPQSSPDGVLIEVRDTGAGIPAERLPHIFEPFYTTKTKGTGLGLSISYNIIESHGGRIDVTSQMGVGTTFTIYLPAASRE